MTRKRFARVLQLVLLIASLGISPQSTAQYKFQRFLEDWSQLDGPPYKLIRLDGTSSLSLGGHLRLRSETHRNFRGTSADDAFTLALATLHADFRTERFRVFAELKASDVLGENRVLARSATEDRPDIEHLFVDLKVASGHTLRLGRQTLMFPKPFIHTARWRNTLRRWDGATWLFEGNQWNGRAFWLHEALTRPDDFNRSTSDRRYAGIFALRQFGDFNLELYITDFYRRLRPNDDGTRAEERRQTVGTRFMSDLGPGRLKIESNLQFGTRGNSDIFAQLFSASYQQTLAGNVKAALRVDVASGDNGPGGNVTGFVPIYDQVHGVAGRMDALWRSNLIDASVGLSRKVGPLLFAAEFHSFHRENTSDAVYAPGGSTIARAGSSGKRIGEELDLRANWDLSARTKLQSGLSITRFASGLETAERTSGYLYFSLEHRF